MICGCNNYKKNRAKEGLKLIEKSIFHDDYNYMFDTIKFTEGINFNSELKTSLFEKNYKLPFINLAARCNSVNCIKILIRNGVNINIYDSKGWLPIHYAAIYHEQYKNEALFALLSCPSVNVNWTTTGGKTIIFNNVKMNTKNKTAYQLANHYLCYGSCSMIKTYIKNKVKIHLKKSRQKNYKTLPIASMAVPCNPSAPLKQEMF